MVIRAFRTKFDGNAAKAARAWGRSRHSLHRFSNGETPCLPQVLEAIGLRRKTSGRDLYEEVWLLATSALNADGRRAP